MLQGGLSYLLTFVRICRPLAMELEASVARLLSVEASVDILGDLNELDGLLGKLFGSGAGFEAFVEAAHLFGLDEKVFLTRSVECLLQELGASEAFAEAHAQSLVKAVTAENLETAKAVGSRLARLQATPADLREVLLIFLPPDSVDQAAAGILDAALQTLGLSPAAREALAGQELLLAEALQGRLDLALLRAVVAAQQLDVDLPEQPAEPAEPARRLRARPQRHRRLSAWRAGQSQRTRNPSNRAVRRLSDTGSADSAPSWSYFPLCVSLDMRKRPEMLQVSWPLEAMVEVDVKHLSLSVITGSGTTSDVRC